MMLFGAAGLILAALYYFSALQMQGALSFLLLIQEAGFVIFILMFAVSLVEIVVMMIALLRLVARVSMLILGLVAAAYVSFAGVYAIGYALLVPDLRGIQFLAAFAFVRWLTLLLIRPAYKTK